MITTTESGPQFQHLVVHLGRNHLPHNCATSTQIPPSMQQVTRQDLQSHTGFVAGVAISPDDRWLASAEYIIRDVIHGDLKIQIRALDAPDTVLHEFVVPRDTIGFSAGIGEVLAFSPDSAMLCTYCISSLILVDVFAGRQIGSILAPDRMLTSIQWSPDCEWILSGGTQYVTTWNAQAGMHCDPPTLPVIGSCDLDNRTPGTTAWCVAIHPNSCNFVSGHGNGAILHWDVGSWGERGSQPLFQTDFRFDSAYGKVTDMCFDSSGDRLVAICKRSSCRVFCTVTGSVLWRRSANSLNSLAISPNDMIVVADEEGHLWCLRAEDGAEIGVVGAHPSLHVASLGFNSTGEVLLSGGVHEVILWTIANESHDS